MCGAALTIYRHTRFARVSGVPGAIRTRGLSLRRAALYPAELQVQSSGKCGEHFPIVKELFFGFHINRIFRFMHAFYGLTAFDGF